MSLAPSATPTAAVRSTPGLVLADTVEGARLSPVVVSAGSSSGLVGGWVSSGVQLDEDRVGISNLG